MSVGGQNWNLWVGYNGSMKVFSFVAPSNSLNGFNSNLKDFFNYLQNSQGYPGSQQHLISKSFLVFYSLISMMRKKTKEIIRLLTLKNHCSSSIRHRAFHRWLDDFDRFKLFRKHSVNLFTSCLLITSIGGDICIY